MMASAARFDLKMDVDEKALVAKAAAFSERDLSAFARPLNLAFTPNPSPVEVHGACGISARIQHVTRPLRELQLWRTRRLRSSPPLPVFHVEERSSEHVAGQLRDDFSL